MKRNDQPRRTRPGLSALGVIGFAAFAMVAAPAPAEAGDRHHHHKYKVYSHGYRHVYGHTRPAVHYVAPPEISNDSAQGETGYASNHHPTLTTSEITA